MTLHWPQLTILTIALLGLGIAAGKHGQPETGKHNFFLTLFSNAIVIWLLYAGGFFK